MQRLVVIIFVFSFACTHSQAPKPHDSLFPIVENDKWGYMDHRGGIVIKPQFEQAEAFSDGLAAIRQKGKYGYINTQGKTVIPLHFDFAYAFNNGYALVYEDAIPQMIRKDGKPIFKNSYPELTMVSENRFIVTNKTHRKGIVDARGKLVVDTSFTGIVPTENNLFIVRGEKNKVSSYTDDIGVIDNNGKFIVPYGTYRYIWPFKNGLSRVEVQTPYQEGNYVGFIDYTGKLAIKITDKKIWKQDEFTGALCKVYLLAKEKNYSGEDYYAGFIDKKGNLVVNDQKFSEVYPFSNNRAFALTRSDGFYLLDGSGKRVGNTSYFRKIGEGFADGKAFVLGENGWQVIDTNAHVLMKRDISATDGNYVTNALFYNAGRTWRFWDLEQNQAPTISFDEYDPSGFHEGLLMIRKDERLSYVDRSGNIVWRQKPGYSEIPRPLNIDYMNRGYYYAYSTIVGVEDGYNGWARSKNVPGQDASLEWIQKGKLNFYLSDDDTSVNKTIKAKKLFIVNSTTDTAFFPAQDSRLYLTIQALDPNNGWKDIEYLPSSWCGNSYHTLHLAPQEYWQFATPVYEGGFQTRLRAALQVYKHGSHKRDDDGMVTIYSNEFTGSINPAQFWRKLEYDPSGLMDPYND